MGEADDLERVVCYGTGSSNPLFSSGESRKPASASPVEQPLEIKPQIHAPATGKGGHESGPFGGNEPEFRPRLVL